MESLFGASFRDVRIHRSAPGGPCAWTYGSDIYLAVPGFDPGSPAGYDVLGHELAHVLQQRYGCVVGAARWRLEAEATAAGRRVARGQPVIIDPGFLPAAAGTPVTLYYQVIAPLNFAANNVAIAVPAHTAPTAATDTWPGQTKAGASFLQMGGGVNLVSGTAAGTSLRLSAGGRMAVEDADLAGRQPKVFYAAQAVIDESNSRLALLGSNFQLVPDAAGVAQQQITVNGVPLLRVTPRNRRTNTSGLGMTAAQQCDALVIEVVGAQNLMPRFEQPLNPPAHLLIEYHVARQLLTPPLPAVLDSSTAANLATTMGGIAVPWGTAVRGAAGPFTARLQQYGVNQFAAPEVGEGFVTSTLIAAVPGATVGQGAMPPTYADHTHLAGVNPHIVQHPRTWGSHWGGVVAKDGADVITLENYARNVEDALAGSDTRYYFQMYNTNPGAAGSTWHATWTSAPMQAIMPAPAAIVAGGIAHAAATHEPVSPGARSFANAITTVVVPPTARFDAIATPLYQVAGVNAIRNNHNLIATAADADAQLLEILKGLYYANVSIANNNAQPRATRQAWEAALLGVITTPSPFYRRNAVAVEWTLRQIRSMPVT
jgi:hypothetical protein